MKIQIETSHCERCGKSIVKTNITIHSNLQAIRDRFGIVCQDCVTSEELHEINMRIGANLEGQ